MLAQLEVKGINSRKLRTSTDFQGLSSPGILFFQFKDFPGYSRTFQDFQGQWTSCIHSTCTVIPNNRLEH